MTGARPVAVGVRESGALPIVAGPLNFSWAIALFAPSLKEMKPDGTYDRREPACDDGLRKWDRASKTTRGRGASLAPGGGRSKRQRSVRDLQGAAGAGKDEIHLAAPSLIGRHNPTDCVFADFRALDSFLVQEGSTTTIFPLA